MSVQPCVKCGFTERRDGRCRPCRNKYSAAWARAHPSKRIRKGQQYSYRRQLRRYASKGVIPTRPKPELCECCNKYKARCLDHDHRNKKFRGWLCNRCNCGIGLLGDNANGVSMAGRYLKRSR